MANTHSGYFITLEGTEGAGKSSNLDYIAGLLQAGGKETLITREPGGTRLGEQIRDILLQQQKINISAEAELIMMFAARAQHIKEIIMPALASGKIVLCDRFTDSSYAYQGGGRKLDKTLIDQLVGLVHPQLKPGLTLLFDVAAETGLKRAGNIKQADRFESEQIEFFNRVRNTYLEIAYRDPDRVKIIDAEQELDAVRQQIKKILNGAGLC